MAKMPKWRREKLGTSSGRRCWSDAFLPITRAFLTVPAEANGTTIGALDNKEDSKDYNNKKLSPI